MSRSRCCLITLLIGGLILLIFLGENSLYERFTPNTARTARVIDWLRDPSTHAEWAWQVGERCGNAPFILPTDGFAGYLWNDTFRIVNNHQGIDIFGGAGLNVTPVVAAYPGYLTRLPEWKSSVIVRIPSDPLQPGRQIWTYYTHLAGPDGESFIAPEFPPGSAEIYVEAGTLLGYQGNYSGSPGNPVGIHLHFSIVLDDGESHFRNELEIENTLDPSSYLGLPLNASQNQEEVPVCARAGRSLKTRYNLKIQVKIRNL